MLFLKTHIPNVTFEREWYNLNEVLQTDSGLHNKKNIAQQER